MSRLIPTGRGDYAIIDDAPHTTWECENCGAENSELDGDCQFCDPDHDYRGDALAEQRERDEIARDQP